MEGKITISTTTIVTMHCFPVIVNAMNVLGAPLLQLSDHSRFQDLWLSGLPIWANIISLSMNQSDSWQLSCLCVFTYLTITWLNDGNQEYILGWGPLIMLIIVISAICNSTSRKLSDVINLAKPFPINVWHNVAGKDSRSVNGNTAYSNSGVCFPSCPGLRDSCQSASGHRRAWMYCVPFVSKLNIWRQASYLPYPPPRSP